MTVDFDTSNLVFLFFFLPEIGKMYFLRFHFQDLGHPHFKLNPSNKDSVEIQFNFNLHAHPQNLLILQLT